MSELRHLPCTIFDHALWGVQSGEGELRKGVIALGECLLLFTSLDSLYGYLDGCPDRETEQLHSTVFSRNRREFGQRAREAAADGLVGALLDARAGEGEAPFL
ncbi:MAG: hypothetical protein FJX77_10260, partial [Armatimonadetes bacterium]|nr:hypothetical protein [Armatimonadota bacterium]